MKKKSIDYIIPKLMVTAPLYAVVMIALGVRVEIWIAVWCIACLALIIQNKIERRKEKEAENARDV